MTTPEKLPKLLILHVGEMFFPEENILQPNYKPDSYLFSNYNSEHLKFLLNSINYPFLVISHISLVLFQNSGPLK